MFHAASQLLAMHVAMGWLTTSYDLHHHHDISKRGCKQIQPKDSCILEEGVGGVESGIAGQVESLQEGGELVLSWVFRICLINQHIHLQ